ncbi:MAG: carbohydrate ABC transporter permease [Halanaerobiales bacterium]|nr:carbohydrate ABC transporter permease [Halanaerobiales bacterium]
MKIKIDQLIIYGLLFLITLTMLVPILNIFALSFTAPDRVAEVKGFTIWPKGFSLINYQVLLNNAMILKSLFNSMLITIIGTAISLVSTAMAAYTLTRENLVGRKFLMTVLIIVMVFEPGLIPEYLVIKEIGLIDSYWSVILFKAVNVYYLIILMRFFEEVPKSLIEAARIDGAGHLAVLFKVLLPVLKPAMATIGLFYAVFRWNEYFRASIYLNSSSKWPLQVILRQFVVLDDTATMLGANNLLSYNEAAQLNFEALQAGTIVIALVPVLLLYPLILKYFTKGTMDGSIKH